MVKLGDAPGGGNVVDRRVGAGRGLAAGAAGVLAAGAAIGFTGVNTVLEALGLGFVVVPDLDAVRRETLAQYATRVVASTEAVWTELFDEEGRVYTPTRVVLHDTELPTGCGSVRIGQAPSYCVLDQTIYLDLAFFNELEAKYGQDDELFDFAPAYVIAHEVGHHVQNLNGVTDLLFAPAADAEREPENRIQVRLELQADCLAGVWAARLERFGGGLEEGDLDEALVVAESFGDDTLQEAETGFIDEARFTHGSAEQRKRWLQRGVDSGSPNACDTFALAYDEL